MILTLDVGSSSIFGGLLDEGKVLASFHKSTSLTISADELGLFLVHWMEMRGFETGALDAIVFCSVVPELNRIIGECGISYFQLEPLTLKAGVRSGLQVKYSNHRELGGDLIANAVGALNLYPEKDLIIVDFGTATSLCAVSMSSEYLGGTLVPGMDIAMKALADRTASLPAVEIQRVPRVCGRDTVSGIQGGLYFGTLGMLRELISRMRKECFPRRDVTVIATGGYASLFEEFHIFDHLVPELVLLGLEQIYLLNMN